MKLYKLKKTCSMMELGGVLRTELSDPKFSENVMKLVNRIVGRGYCFNFNSIIYNSTSLLPYQIRNLRKAGFRKVNAYTGFLNSNVTTWIKNL